MYAGKFSKINVNTLYIDKQNFLLKVQVKFLNLLNISVSILYK